MLIRKSTCPPLKADHDAFVKLVALSISGAGPAANELAPKRLVVDVNALSSRPGEGKPLGWPLACGDRPCKHS